MAAPAVLTVQSVVTAGLEEAWTAASADGHLVPIDDGNFLHVKNAGGVDTTVTIAGGYIGGASRYLADRTIVVTAAEERFILLSKYDDRGGTSSGQALVTFSATASVSLAALS